MKFEDRVNAVFEEHIRNGMLSVTWVQHAPMDAVAVYLDAPSFRLRLADEGAAKYADIASHVDRDKWVPLDFAVGAVHDKPPFPPRYIDAEEALRLIEDNWTALERGMTRPAYEETLRRVNAYEDWVTRWGASIGSDDLPRF